MEEIFIHRPFFEILVDSIILLDKSYLEENKNTEKFNETFVKASILNSILLLESCANCCLDFHPYPKKFLKTIDKISTLEKYEFLLITRDEKKHIKRGSTIVQIFNELVSIRNQYVHPKTKKKEFKNNKKIKAGEKYRIETQQELTNTLKIPKQSTYWNPSHGIKVLKAVNLFFNQFFLKWCEFTPVKVTAFLMSEVQNQDGIHKMMPQRVIDMIEIAKDRWKIDFSYIDENKM